MPNFSCIRVDNGRAILNTYDSLEQICMKIFEESNDKLSNITKSIFKHKYYEYCNISWNVETYKFIGMDVIIDISRLEMPLSLTERLKIIAFGNYKEEFEEGDTDFYTIQSKL